MGGKEYTFEELKAQEFTRSRILKFIDKHYFSVLSHWTGTCLRVLLFDPLFWITVAIYAVIVGLDGAVVYGNVDSVSKMDIGVVGVFLSFFLSLFINQANTRFNVAHGHSMKCKGCIAEVASMAASSMSRENADVIVRHLNAAHLAGYVGLSPTYSKTNFFDTMNTKYEMLTNDEVDRLSKIDMDKGGDYCWTLIVWCLIDISEAAKAKHIDGKAEYAMNTKVLALRASMSALYNAEAQPFPFYYIHFLTLLSVLYLPLFAITIAFAAVQGDFWVSSVIGGLTVTLQAIFVVGLRLLGLRMMHPYGDDPQDLRVITYILTAWDSSKKLLSRTSASYSAKK